MKISTIVISIVAVIITVAIGGYFGAKYYLSAQGPEYLFMHPTIAKIFSVTPVCSTVCLSNGVCGADGKNYCNSCVAFQHKAGYAHDGMCTPASWKTVTNSDYGFSLRYPGSFFDTGHEPKILVGDCNYNVFPGECPNINNIVINDMVAAGGDVNAIKSNLSYPNYWKNPSGQKQTIDNVQYCLYQNSDAAMGHVYNYYYYATVRDSKCIVANFATSTANCDFYLPLEAGNTAQATNYNNCVATNKNQPITLSEIINTFKFTK
jgi:hypothetical protein